jgi:hypothetical protein
LCIVNLLFPKEKQNTQKGGKKVEVWWFSLPDGGARIPDASYRLLGWRFRISPK